VNYDWNDWQVGNYDDWATDAEELHLLARELDLQTPKVEVHIDDLPTRRSPPGGVKTMQMTCWMRLLNSEPSVTRQPPFP
jgi:hypothetical protein